jgi:hypothetical protein
MIGEELKGVSKCEAEVLLRNRSKDPEASCKSTAVIPEVEWYSEAFGERKDFMQVRFVLIALRTLQGQAMLRDLTVSFEYTMNEELKECYEPEFNKHKYTLNMVQDGNKFEISQEFPLGKISQVEFKHGERLLRGEADTITTGVDISPVVKSEADRRKDKERLEAELQNKEAELKAKHMEARQRKQKQEEEKLRIEKAMSLITDKLGEVWKNIEHSFISSEEEERECIYLFSVHYETLFPVYQAYARQVPQIFSNHENDYILLQHFFHFVKEYAFGCTTMEEYKAMMSSLSPLLEKKVVDTLNIYNGFNFALFIEGILRIALYKARLALSAEAKMEDAKDLNESDQAPSTHPSPL